jgi:hypothetical protein
VWWIFLLWFFLIALLFYTEWSERDYHEWIEARRAEAEREAIQWLRMYQEQEEQREREQQEYWDNYFDNLLIEECELVPWKEEGF